MTEHITIEARSGGKRTRRLVASKSGSVITVVARDRISAMLQFGGKQVRVDDELTHQSFRDWLAVAEAVGSRVQFEQ